MALLVIQQQILLQMCSVFCALDNPATFFVKTYSLNLFPSRSKPFPSTSVNNLHEFSYLCSIELDVPKPERHTKHKLIQEKII